MRWRGKRKITSQLRNLALEAHSVLVGNRALIVLAEPIWVPPSAELYLKLSPKQTLLSGQVRFAIFYSNLARAWCCRWSKDDNQSQHSLLFSECLILKVLRRKLRNLAKYLASLCACWLKFSLNIAQVKVVLYLLSIGLINENQWMIISDCYVTYLYLVRAFLQSFHCALWEENF